jgi:hypothetical protein
MTIIGHRGPRLAAFVDEWWALYAERQLEPATLRTCRWVWEQHAPGSRDRGRARRRSVDFRTLTSAPSVAWTWSGFDATASYTRAAKPSPGP